MVSSFLYAIFSRIRETKVEAENEDAVGGGMAMFSSQKHNVFKNVQIITAFSVIPSTEVMPLDNNSDDHPETESDKG